MQEGQVLVYRLPGLSIRATESVVRSAEETFPDWNPTVGRPPALELVAALRSCLCRLRRNVTFQELGDDFGIGTSTAWSYAHEMAGFFAQALGCSAEDLADQVAGEVCLVDGTSVPTFDRRHRTDLYSGKHREHGMNVQAIVDVHGRLVATSTAHPGSRHDSRCFGQAGFAALVVSAGGVGDAGYQGCELITPIKKKPGVARAESDIEFNTALAKIRVGAEWGIGHIKNWRILASRYRSDLSRIDTVIQAVTRLFQDLISGRVCAGVCPSITPCPVCLPAFSRVRGPAIPGGAAAARPDGSLRSRRSPAPHGMPQPSDPQEHPPGGRAGPPSGTFCRSRGTPWPSNGT
ncbi:MAG: transposase family protein, partial [Pseudonocardiaceae bacterium]